MNNSLKRFVIAVFLLLLSFLVGMVGFIGIEEYDLVNAFYMTVITISTVGFAEVHELSATGRVFTSFYILMNLGIFAYVVSVLTTYLFEGELQSILKDFMSDREISKLKNHVIVCGHGRNGSQACEELRANGKEFVVIDKDPEVAERDFHDLKSQILIADATIDKNLKRVGIERADVIIITTSSDASNVFITLTARALKPDIYIIARASAKESQPKLYRAGADKVIMPDFLGGIFMAQMVTKPAVIEFLELLSGMGGELYHLEELSFEQLKPEFRNKTLLELRIRNRTGCTVIGIKDNIRGLIPNPQADAFIGENDTLIVLGSREQIKELLIIYGKN